MVGGMSSSLRRSLILATGGVLVVVGVVLIATEMAVGIGASMTVWGLAAVSYRFTAAGEAGDRFRSPLPNRTRRRKVVL